MKHTFIILAIVTAFTGACSSTPGSSAKWPSELPPEAYFKNYYLKDTAHQQVAPEDRYLLWVKRFYFGWELQARGWLQATQELVDTLPDAGDKQLAKAKSLEIAKLTSAEWAKDNCCRRINTRHIVVWANALNRSIVEHEQLKMLDKVLTDVQALLNESISPEDIQLGRYCAYEPFATNINGDF